MSKTIRVGVISKIDLLHVSIGHRGHISGTGAWRNKRKNPKGGRCAANRKAISEY